MKPFISVISIFENHQDTMIKIFMVASGYASFNDSSSEFTEQRFLLAPEIIWGKLQRPHCSPEAWNPWVYFREMIPFYGRKIQVSEILWFTQLQSGLGCIVTYPKPDSICFPKKTEYFHLEIS